MLGSLASPTGYAGGCLRASPFFMPAPIERPGAKQKTSRRTGGLCVLWGMVRCQHVRAQGLCGCVLSLAERFAIVKGENARVAQRHPAQRERKKRAFSAKRQGAGQATQRDSKGKCPGGHFGRGGWAIRARDWCGVLLCRSDIGDAFLRISFGCSPAILPAVWHCLWRLSQESGLAGASFRLSLACRPVR